MNPVDLGFGERRSWCKRLTGEILILALLLIVGAGAAHAQSPPDTPVVIEPTADGEIVSPADVHMETGPFSDPDGDSHAVTDWEIWTLHPAEAVWVALGATDLSRTHVHLGDGVFQGSHAGRHELITSTDYRLRVRFQDSEGLWSDYAIRFFTTGAPELIFPMLLDDVAGTPTPSWTDESDIPLNLPFGDRPGVIRLESPLGAELLEFIGLDGSEEQIENPPPLGGHVALRVLLSGGSSALAAPISRIAITDGSGIDHLIYLPGVALAPGDTACLWIAIDGSSFWGSVTQTEPDFSTLAQSAPVPWQVSQTGYRVDIVASGFQLPVNIAFVPSPGDQPDDPFFYVTELYGTIKVVTRDFSVHEYATGLLNFDPGGQFPGSGEQGLSGIAVDPATGDLYAGMLYDAAPPNGPHYPKVVRLTSIDGGRTAASETTILDMVGETQGASHFISNITIGPDGRLYVHMGDGFDPSKALNLSSFRGKVLRLALDGSAPPDNPFYYAGDGITATDYIFAYGLRNPFGGTWRELDGAHYEVEDGPSHNDRLARVDPGASYGWNGSDSSMIVRAIYTWDPPHSPVNIACVQSGTFGGSDFPLAKQDHAFVTESGPTYASGPQPNGKRVVEFVIGQNGDLVAGPINLIRYVGSGKATAVGLAAGPDGLYFSDLYKDQGYNSPIDPGANILRIAYEGTVDFAADTHTGPAPLDVQFTDLSDVPGSFAWEWSFGDGAVSDVRNPAHQYTQLGVYNVRLRVTGPQGAVVKQRNGYIRVGPDVTGLLGEYFSDPDLTRPFLHRIDPVVDFDWGAGAPDSSMQPDDFSVRWTGTVWVDQSRFWTFHVTVEDGVRLWVGPQLLVDQWQEQGLSEYSGSISLLAGRDYPIEVDYFNGSGPASARLEWSSPTQPRQVIPTTHLFPANASSVPVERSAWGLAPLELEILPEGSRGAPRGSSTPLVTGPTQVVFGTPVAGRLTLALFDPAGRQVLRLFDGDGLGDRSYRASLKPQGAPSGVYFLRLALDGPSGRKTISRKILLVPR